MYHNMFLVQGYRFGLTMNIFFRWKTSRGFFFMG